MKILLLLILCTNSIDSICIAQGNNDHIINNFNTLEYYPDSTIKVAYNLKRGKIRGYCVEYDSSGIPEWIGKYRNGLKHGEWLGINGISWFYTRGEIDWAYLLSRQGSSSRGDGLELGDQFEKLYVRLTK